jgi:hypothetical protein
VRRHDREVKIKSRDYWFKLVDFLQQNWALVDRDEQGDGCTVFFFADDSGVFDTLRFSSESEAHRALARNGFGLFDLDPEAKRFLRKPEPPFHESLTRMARSIRPGDSGSVHEA